MHEYINFFKRDIYFGLIALGVTIVFCVVAFIIFGNNNHKSGNYNRESIVVKF